MHLSLSAPVRGSGVDVYVCLWHGCVCVNTKAVDLTSTTSLGMQCCSLSVFTPCFFFSVCVFFFLSLFLFCWTCLFVEMLKLSDLIFFFLLVWHVCGRDGPARVCDQCVCVCMYVWTHVCVHVKLVQLLSSLWKPYFSSYFCLLLASRSRDIRYVVVPHRAGKAESGIR
jgi:hypothetical protein